MNSLDAFVEAYESAQSQGEAALADFLPERNDPLYHAVLRELVRVDMEYSWKRARPRSLDDYRAAYPGLFEESETVQALAFEEFRLRRQAGQSPSASEYRRRYRIDLQSWPPLPLGSVAAPAPPARDGAWDILEQLLKQLQHCERQDEQVRLVVGALRECLDADVVFHLHADVAAPAVDVVGPKEATPAWCQALAQKIIQTHGPVQGQMLLPPLALPVADFGPTAASAAVVRVGQGTSGWLVAASLDPRRRFATPDLKVMLMARRILLGQREYSRTYAKLKDALFSLIHCLTAMIDARDPYTCGHSERVARIAVRLGQQMGLPARVQSDLYLAGLLHDIGKIGIRDDVLANKDKLTPDEFSHMQEHVLIGDRIVTTVKQLASLRDGVRNHHERIDGTGYPDRLAGKNIPLLARVLSVADACDAMMSSRPYRPAMPTEQIESILSAGAGVQWDAEVIGHFMACRHELYAICQRGLGRSVLHAVENVLHQATAPSDLPPAGAALLANKRD